MTDLKKIHGGEKPFFYLWALMKVKQFQKPFMFCLIVILMLGILSFIPPFKVGQFSFKKVNLLPSVEEAAGELLSEEYNGTLPDSPTEDTVVTTLVTDSLDVPPIVPQCRDGITCIEDYTQDQTGITTFLNALSNLKQKRHGGSVRIAFYGDSFIEGDIFCGSVRDTLQTLFGGRGVGFVPITSHLVGFRNTIRQDFGNWATFSIINKGDSTARFEMGPAGYCFKPKEDNWVEYKASRQRYLREFETIRLYYKNRGNAFLHYTVNDTFYRVAELRKSNRLREWKRENLKARKVEFIFENPDSLEIYGASFEGKPGVYVDNFAMRGNSGIGLHAISPEMFRNFNQYRDYKLILLQYGLNVINFDSSRYAWYADRMVTVIERLKKVFPNASIVLLSVSDRSANVNGKYRTIRSIPSLRNTQREIARKTHIVFWDLYEAMGGENSMVKFVRSNPALAAKDYTHLTFKGGKKLAGELVGSLLYELEKYEKKQPLP